MSYEVHRDLRETPLSERLGMAFSIVRTLAITVPIFIAVFVAHRLGSGDLAWATFDLFHWVQVTTLTVATGSFLVVATFVVVPVIERELF